MEGTISFACYEKAILFKNKLYVILHMSLTTNCRIWLSLNIMSITTITWHETLVLKRKTAMIYQQSLDVWYTGCSRFVSEHEFNNWISDPNLLQIRQSVIKNLPDDTKEVMMTAHKTLAASDIDEFMDAADEAIASAGLMLKKKDNKKDR